MYSNPLALWSEISNIAICVTRWSMESSVHSNLQFSHCFEISKTGAHFW